MSLYMRGVLMATLTAVLFGAMSSVAKIISADGLSQLTVMAYRAIFVVLALSVGFTVTGRKHLFRISRQMAPRYAALGFFSLVCAAGGFMMSCMYLSVPHAVILHYTFPLSTMALAFFISREIPSLLEVLAAILILVGMYIGFAAGKESLEPLSVPGVVWGVVSVFGFSAQMLLSRTMSRAGKSDPVTQLFYVNLFGGLIVIIGKSVFWGWGDLSGLSWEVFAWMQYPAIGGSLCAFWLLFASLRYISPTTVSLICTLEIVMALAAMPLLLGSTPTAQEAVGALIIMAAVIGSTLFKRPKAVPAAPPQKAAEEGSAA